MTLQLIDQNLDALNSAHDTVEDLLESILRVLDIQIPPSGNTLESPAPDNRLGRIGDRIYSSEARANKLAMYASVILTSLDQADQPAPPIPTTSVSHRTPKNSRSESPM